MVEALRNIGELYAGNVISFIIFYTTFFFKFVETIDLYPIFDHSVYLISSVYFYFFPELDTLFVLSNFFEAYVVFPLTSFYKGLVYVCESYISFFETDFCIKLDKQLKVALCRLLDKPHCEDKNLLYTLFVARSVNRKGFALNSLPAELYYIFCLFTMPTFYLFVFFYCVAVLFYVALNVLSFLSDVYLGTNFLDDDRSASSAYLVESEKELGSIDDFLYVFFSLSLIYTLYCGFFFFYSIGLENSLFAISLMGFPILVVTAMSMPINFL